MGVIEIFTKLTLDDQASKSLQHVKEGFKEVEASEAHASKGAGFFQQTLSTIVGMNFVGAIHKVVEFGESFVKLAGDEEKFLKSNAALMASADGVSFEKGMEEAEAFAGQLDEIGVASGQMIDDVKAAFSSINEITGAGSAGMRENVKVVDDMSQVSRVLGKDVGWLTSQFGIMAETGMVRAKSQLFLLLKGVGAFQGEAKQAALEFGKMAEEDRVRLLTEGVGKLADKFRTIPIGFGDYVKSIKNVIDLTKEDVGMPILRALTPVVKQMLDLTRQLRPLLVNLGEEMAGGLAKMLKQLTGWLKEGLEYLSTHRIQITQTIENAVAKIKAVFDFILAHKEVIGAMFAMKMAGPSVMGAASALGGAGKAVGGAVVAASGMGTAGAFVGGVAGLATALPIAAAATYAWIRAIDQWNKYDKESEDHLKGDVRARQAYMQTLLETGGGYKKLTQQQLEFNATVAKKFEDEAHMLGLSSAQAREFTDAALKAVDANQALTGSVEAAEDYFKDLKATQDAVSQAGDMGPLNDVATVMQGLGDAFQVASKNANLGMQQHIATVLGGSRDMQLAFLESAKLTSEGYAALAELLPESAKEFKEELERRAAGVGTEGAKGHGPSINFNGGQMFKIQQDFRDQDPDRIAVLFRRDILSAAERRVQASTGSPFGT